MFVNAGQVPSSSHSFPPEARSTPLQSYPGLDEELLGLYQRSGKASTKHTFQKKPSSLPDHGASIRRLLQAVG